MCLSIALEMNRIDDLVFYFALCLQQHGVKENSGGIGVKTLIAV